MWTNNNRIPEYLRIFSNRGPVRVRIKFTSRRDQARKIPEFCAEWPELMSLINGESRQPYKSIVLDSYICPISKIEMSPEKGLVVIHVGDTGLPGVRAMHRHAAGRLDRS